MSEDNTGTPQQPPRLRSLGAAPRRTAQPFSGAGYSRFVRIARLMLPVAALVIIGIVIARLTASPQQSIPDIASLPQEDKATPGESQLIGATYEGVDAQGRPYTVTAEEAARDMQSPDTVRLTQPTAELRLDPQRTIGLRAAAGTLDTAASTLALSGGVVFTESGGHEMQMQDVSLDIKTRHARSESMVTAQGPLGTLTATGMDVSDGGAFILFKGPATMQIRSLSPVKGTP